MPPHTRNNEIERRSGIDRRQFSYAVHIPERRKDGERRRDRSQPAKKCQGPFPLLAPILGEGPLLID